MLPEIDKLHFGIADQEEDLLQILALQRLNLKSEISEQTKTEQGFLTVNHSMEELLNMQKSTPQIVAKYQGQVVEFALAMLPESGKLIADLKPMFVILDSLSWKEVSLLNSKYYVMGQICVGEDFRGKGVFDQLYETHRTVYREGYALCVTEISTSNFRSQRAHERVGFRTIHKHVDHVDEWNIVVREF